MSIIFVLNPADIISHVLGYRSVPGYFGIPSSLQMLGMERAVSVYHVIFYALLAMCILVIGNMFWNGRQDEKEIVLIPALILLSLPTFGPAWAPQYAFWFMPLLLVTYALYTERWKSFLIGFESLISAATYIIIYATLPAFGWSLLYLMDPEKIPGPNQFFLASDPIQNLVQQAGTPHWQMIINSPLFVVSVVTVVCGFKLLNVSTLKIKITGKLIYVCAAVIIFSSLLIFTEQKRGSKIDQTTVADLEMSPDQLNDPTNNAVALNNLAWSLTTSTNVRVRRRLSSRLPWHNRRLAGTNPLSDVPMMIGTLAAAYAEAGRFQEAVSHGQ